MSILLTIDLGTTGIKAAVWGEDGLPLSRAYRGRQVERGPDGSAEQSPEENWRLQNEVAREAVAAAGRPVSAVVLTHQRGTCAPANEAGEALGNYVVWMDRRCLAVCDRFRAELGDAAYYDAFLHPIQPYVGFPKLVWMEETHPGAARYLPAQSIHIARMTGESPVTDPSSASSLGPWDQRNHRWNTDMAERFGLPLDRLPPVTDSPCIVGELMPGVAAEMGLQPGTPVVLGSADGQAAALGAGCKNPGDIMINVGTATGVLAALHSPVPHPSRAMNTSPHALPDLFEMEGHTQSTGASFDWIRKILGDLTPAETIALAQESTHGANGVVVVPTFNGVSTPVPIPRAKGRIIELTLDHTRADLARSMLEAVCYEIRWIHESLVEAVGYGDHYIVTGGMSRSRWWTGLLATILGVPVIRLAAEDATLAGCAWIGRVALGESTEGIVRYGDLVEPDFGVAAAHEPAYSRFVSALMRQKEEIDDCSTRS